MLSCLVLALYVGCTLENDLAAELNFEGLFPYGTNRPQQYFPAYLHDAVDSLGGKAFHAKGLEMALRKNRKENLSESYTGKDVIRVAYVSAFAYSHYFVISLIRTQNSYELIVKESYGSLIIDSLDDDRLTYLLEYDSSGHQFEKVGYESNSFKRGERVAISKQQMDPVISIKRYEVRQSIWNEAMRRLNEGYFRLNPFERSSGLDGEYILVETHFSNGYYAVERWSPQTNNPLALVADYLALACNEWQLTSDKIRLRILPDSLVINE